MIEHLPGHHDVEVIDDGTLHRIVRAVDDGTSRRVIIKMLRDEMADATQAGRLKREFSIAEGIKSDRIVPVHDLRMHRNLPFLIKGDVGGTSLDRVLDARRLSLKEVVALGVNIAEALRDVHAAGVMHKDVKPANVIVSDDLQKVWLTDFDISSQLRRERLREVDLAELAGSLPYVAPEQTGRMNRSVDTRSDLYSLGVTLYEMLAGRRPFISDDAMEIVHCHIARHPQPLTDIDPSVPPVVNDIVLRLMAKTAEDRYQSTTGVIHDLRRCLQMVEVDSIATFDLGSADIPLTLRIPEKLYGRSNEVRTLLDVYHRAAQGTMEIACVSGYSGIGKSSLVQELHKPITADRGRFHSGKFDQYRRAAPYSAITSALDALGRQLLTDDSVRTERWMTGVRDRVGDALPMLTTLVPSFAMLFGEQTDVQETGGVEAQRRQNQALIDVLAVTATIESPLVLFIDDMQWADTWSLSMLEQLAAAPISHLLLLLAWRDNETPNGHPLHRTLEQFRRHRVPFTDIVLTPLSVNDVSDLVRDTLSPTAASTVDLARLVHRKTDGNPFFIAQFMTSLYDEDVLSINEETRSWQWDIDALESIAVTDNVVDLLTQRLQTFDTADQRALAVAAIIGDRFDVRILASVIGTEVEVNKALWQSLVDGLISTEDINTAVFMHDRIRQAAFELVDDADRPAIHQQIADAYFMVYDHEALNDHLFDLSGHLIESFALPRADAERLRMASLLERAGAKAMTTSAFSAARKFFEASLEAHGADLWERDAATALRLSLRLATSMWSSSEHEDLERFLDEVDKHDIDIPSQVRIVNLRRRIAFSRLHLEEATALALKGLALLGYRFPRKPTQLHAGREVLRLHLMMRGRTPASLAAMPPSTHERSLMAIEIIAEISEAVYFNDPNLFPLLLLKQMELTLRHGNHRNSASVYVGYGIIRVIALNDVERSYALCRMAMDLPERFNAHELRPKNELSYAYMVQQRKEHIDKTYAHFQFAYRVGLETSMHSDVANSTIGMVYHALFQGRDNATNLKDCEIFLETLTAIKQQRHHESQQLYRATLRALLDPTMPRTLDLPDFSGEKYLATSREFKDYTSIASYGANGSLVFMAFQDYTAARTILDPSLKYASFLKATISEIWFPFVDALLASILADDAGTRRKALRTLRRSLKTCRRWAQHAPMNYEHMVHLLEAEQHRLRNRNQAASVSYAQAVRKAGREGFVACEAFANDLAARFHRSIGDVELAEAYEAGAYLCYKRWGVAGRVRQYEAEHPDVQSGGRRSTGTTGGRTHTSSTGSNDLDLGTVMKASHVIAAEIDRDKLERTTLKIMMENAGADLGMLIMKVDGAWKVDASHRFDHDPRGSGQQDYPRSIISYVERSLDRVVLNNAVADDQFGADPYIAKHQPPSIICMPILHQSKLVGILYLENTLLQGAFTQDRIDVLHLLTVQSAISLENAALYANLEQKVEERTRELQLTNELLDAERDRTEKLLLNVLPAGIVERLKKGETTIADRTDDVSVLFADIANFTHYAATRSAEDVIQLLNNVFNTFDDLVTKYGVEKIKTIGDAYMVVSGVPHYRADHAEALALLAHDMHKAVPVIREQNSLPELGIRIGVHTGPVIAGVIGRSKFSFDLWGDTVNVAARMESHGRIGSIHASEDFVRSLQQQSQHQWLIEERGMVDVKGRGKVRTFWINGG